MDNYYERNNHLELVDSGMSPEALFAKEMDHVLEISDKIFSGEECHGKYLDLH
jgi:hypothetical protein